MDFTTGKKLGKGAFGSVREVIVNGKEYAAKIFATEPPNKIDAKTLANLDHENIVRSYGAIYKPYYMLIMEKCDECLYHVIYEQRDRLSYENFRNWTNDCASGMAFLHSKNITHRDLKSLNVLLKDNKAKICDFDFSRPIPQDEKEYMKSTCGTNTHMAPEFFELTESFKTAHTQKVDIWSFGVLVWELLMQRLPYDTRKLQWNKVASNEFRNGAIRLPFPTELPIDTWQLFTDCLNPFPEKRPTFKIICERLRNLPGIDEDKWADWKLQWKIAIIEYQLQSPGTERTKFDIANELKEISTKTEFCPTPPGEYIEHRDYEVNDLHNSHKSTEGTSSFHSLTHPELDQPDVPENIVFSVISPLQAPPMEDENVQRETNYTSSNNVENGSLERLQCNPRPSVQSSKHFPQEPGERTMQKQMVTVLKNSLIEPDVSTLPEKTDDNNQNSPDTSHQPKINYLKTTFTNNAPIARAPSFAKLHVFKTENLCISDGKKWQSNNDITLDDKSVADSQVKPPSASDVGSSLPDEIADSALLPSSPVRLMTREEVLNANRKTTRRRTLDWRKPSDLPGTFLKAIQADFRSKAQQQKAEIMPVTCSDVFKILFAILLPPLGVFLEVGCTVQLAINILLTILGYIPGIIHAIWIICAN